MIAFSFMYVYQIHLYQHYQAGKKVRWGTSILFLLSLVYCVFGYYNASWTNPNPAIVSLFKPIQDWILIKR